MTDKKQTHVERVKASNEMAWCERVTCTGTSVCPPTYSAATSWLLETLAAKLDAAEAELARRDAAAAEAQRPAEERATRNLDELYAAATRATARVERGGRVVRGICVQVWLAWQTDADTCREWRRTYRIGATESQIAADLRAALKALEGMS